MADTKLSAETPRGPIQLADLVRMVRPGVPNLDGSFSGADIAEFIRDVVASTLVQGANVTIIPDDVTDKITIAAAAGGGGGGSAVPVHPGYVSQRVYRPAPYGPTPLAPSDGAIGFYPMLIREEVTLDRLAAHLVTSASGSEIKIGIYAHDAAARAPGAKVVELAAPLSGAGTSGISVAGAFGSNPTLAAGLYWLAVLVSGTATWTCIGNADAQTSALLGTTAASNMLQAATCLYLAGFGYANGLPANYSAVAGAAPATVGIPLIGFRKA